jgi:hypothetical protein
MRDEGVPGSAVMDDADEDAPRAVAGITNFGWAVPALVARGEQPPLANAWARR